jgi:hypothetical protein
MKTTTRGILIGSCVVLLGSALLAQPMPQTKKEAIKGAAASTTEEVNGTVVLVEGKTLLVRMSNGDMRTFEPPASRRFIIDGQEVGLSDLKPGTKLKATVTTTKTSVTDRTTTVGTGKVWFVSGNTVILTLPNNENRMYKVAESYRFTVDGQKATVHDLRKGMTVAAEKIVEEPRVEIASNTTVTGSAPPPPRPVVAENRAPAPTSAPAPAPAPAPVRAAPEPAPAPAAVAEARAPATLPKTGSPLPLVGLLGFLCTGASLGLRAIRRFQ